MSVTTRPARASLLAAALTLTAVLSLSPGAVPGGAASAVGAGAPAAAAQALPAPVDHPGLVPAQPRRGYPRISDQPRIRQVNANCPNGCDVPREVLGTDQVGPFVVAGGNFLTVDLPDGTSVDQPYFAAWRLGTKELVCRGLHFDDEVLEVLPGSSPTSVYVAGRFSQVTEPDGQVVTRRRVAELDLGTCTVDRGFVPPTLNDKVDDLALLGDRLFVGGDFDTIGGQPVSTLAELDASSGRLDPDFRLSFSGGITSRLRAMAVDPAGTRLLVAGRFGSVSGNGVSVAAPTAMIDVTGATPVLTPHSSTGYTDTGGRRLPPRRLQDASFSPDGRTVGLAFGTASSADYVYLTRMAETAGTRFRWKHYMRDSSYGIGVSDEAVYVAGHFCKPDAGPRRSKVMAPVPGISKRCTGAMQRGGVWRSKLAALSPRDGTPLTWNPGSHSFRGGQVVTVTERGLLVGFDGYRTNNIKTGALAFFDLGA